MSEKVLDKKEFQTDSAGIELHTGDLDLVLWAKDSKELEAVTKIYLQTFTNKKAKK